MQRKVIQLAGRTFVLSLPQAWVQKHQIVKGQELSVAEQDASLVLTPASKVTLKQIHLDVSGLDERTLKYTLSGLYKAGYTEIVLSPINPLILSTVRSMLKSLLLGFALVEETEKKCVVKNITLELPEQFQPTLRRAFLVTLSLAQQIFTHLQKKHYRQLPALIELEESNNQLTNFCERLLTSFPGSPRDHCFLYTIIWNLEKVGDDYKAICQRFYSYKKTLPPSLLLCFEQVNQLFHGYYQLLYKFELPQLAQLQEFRKRIEYQLHHIPVTTPEEFLLLHYLMGLLTKLNDFSTTMIALHYSKQ